MNININKIFDGKIILLFLIALFFIARFPALDKPLHQDEYKWPLYAYNIGYEPGSVPHPPLTEFIYTKIGPIVGSDNFRLIPLFFSLINLFLLFYLCNFLFNNRKVAIFSIFLYSISFFSILASLMVDVDGAIMPFFFLVLLIGYFKFKHSGWKDKRAIIPIVFGIIGGILIKVSFIIAIFSIALDFAIEKKAFSNIRKILNFLSISAIGLLVLVSIILFSKYIFPSFNIEYSFKYWKHFANSSSFLDRGWLQTFIQFVKALLYTSPLLLTPLLFLDRDIFTKTRAFLIFILSSLVFYLFLFDFSIGALDRYFELLVIPLCVICGAIYERYLSSFYVKNKWLLSIILVVGLIIFLQFIHHFVPPLYPKTEWVSRVISLKWNFLYPFMGGSGPIPFYVSFAFIGLSWIFSLSIGLFGIIKKDFTKQVLFSVLILGLSYNIVFAEEYLFGKINGSSEDLVHKISSFANKNDDIKMITVYNDNGGWDVQSIGKYRKRLYIDPKFDINEKVKTLNKYKEHYMVVDIPHIDSGTIYAEYFNSCRVVFEEKSKYITGKVYDCKKSPVLKVK